MILRVLTYKHMHDEALEIPDPLGILQWCECITGRVDKDEMFRESHS